MLTFEELKQAYRNLYEEHTNEYKAIGSAIRGYLILEVLNNDVSPGTYGTITINLAVSNFIVDLNNKEERQALQNYFLFLGNVNYKKLKGTY